MIYELRTYTFRPGASATMVKAASTVSREIRGDNYGKLEGYWSTEIGPLNQVMHLWSYSDLNERTRLRAELGKNPRWNGDYVPVIRPPAGAPGHSPDERDQAAGCAGHARQHLRIPLLSRQDRRRRRTWLDLYTGILPTREKYSKIVGLLQTEAGQPNEVCHIWAYPDLNARAAVRGTALKDPAWQEFLAKSSPLSKSSTRPSCCRRRTRR